MAARARISVTLPPHLVEAADARARALDRPRSWVVAEALRRFIASTPVGEAGAAGRGPLRVAEPAAPPYGAAGLGEYRLAQLEADLALTPEQRVREADKTARVAEAVSTGSRPQQIVFFDRYEDYLEWKRRQEILS